MKSEIISIYGLKVFSHGSNGYNLYINYEVTKQSGEITRIDCKILKDKSLTITSCIRNKSGLILCFSCNNLKIFKKNNNYYAETKANIKFSFSEIMQVILNDNGYTFIHSASVSINNHVTIFSAEGGVGKTALVSQLANESNTEILGDDLCIMSRQGNVYPYPRNLCLYEYHEKYMPEVFKKINITYTSKIILPKIIRRLRLLLMRYLSIKYPSQNKTIKNEYTLVSPYEAFPNKIANDMKLFKKFIYLKKDTHLSTTFIKNSTLKDKIIKSTKDEWPRLNHDEFNVFSVLDEIIENFLDNGGSSIEITVPIGVDGAKYAKKVLSIIRN